MFGPFCPLRLGFFCATHSPNLASGACERPDFAPLLISRHSTRRLHAPLANTPFVVAFARPTQYISGDANHLRGRYFPATSPPPPAPIPPADDTPASPPCPPA